MIARSGVWKSRMQVARKLEPQAVLRHLVIDARARPDDAVQRAERAEHHERRDHAGRAGADQHLERVGGDARRGHHLLDRQHQQVDGVEADVADA